MSGDGDCRVHRTDARPFQRPGRRLCRLRHLSRSIRIFTRSIFFMTIRSAKAACEAFLERHFRHRQPLQNPRAKDARRLPDAPLIWRYFVAASAHHAGGQPAGREGICGALRDPHQYARSTARMSFPAAKTWGYSKRVGYPGGCRPILPAGGIRGLLLDGPWPLSHQHAGLVGRRASLCAAGLFGGAQRGDLLLRRQPPLH